MIASTQKWSIARCSNALPSARGRRFSEPSGGPIPWWRMVLLRSNGTTIPLAPFSCHRPCLPVATQVVMNLGMLMKPCSGPCWWLEASKRTRKDKEEAEEARQIPNPTLRLLLVVLLQLLLQWKNRHRWRRFPRRSRATNVVCSVAAAAAAYNR